MTLFDLLEYAKIGVFTLHDGDRQTQHGILNEINTQWVIWDDFLGEQLEDLALSKLPFTDGSEPEDEVDYEPHWIDSDDGYNPFLGLTDWDE